MKVQDDDHDDFERQGGPQTTSSKVKDLFEFEVNAEYDGGEEDAPAADGDGFQREGARKGLTGSDRQMAKYGADAQNFTVAGNSEIKDGCVKERGCKDVFCLVIFLAAVVAMIGVGVHGLLHGNIGKYTAPLDSKNNFCGYSKGVEAYPYMYFKNLLGSPSEILGSGVCVKACPATAGASLSCPTAEAAACAKIKDSHKSYAAGYFCVPSLASLRATHSPAYETWRAMLKEMLTKNPTGHKIYDLYLSSRAIYISIGMAVVYCLGYIYLMSLFAEYIAWAMIGLTQVGLLAGALACLLAWKDRADPEGPISPADAQKLLGGGIALAILALIFAVLVCCGFNSLRTAINVVDASADFLRRTKRLLFVPILYFIVNVLVVFAWVVIVACFNSMGTITADTAHIPQFRKCTFATGAQTDQALVAWALLFGLLWVVAFNQATSSFIVMVSATSYYFDSDQDKEGSADVGLGFHLAYMSHAGSLAFGSFIVALVQLIRIVFMTLAE